MDEYDPNHLLDKIGFGITKDGKVVDLRFVRKNGTAAYVQCEYGNLSVVRMRVEQAAAEAYQLQKAATAGADPETFAPLTTSVVDKMRGMYSREGKPVIMFVLKSGMRQALSVPEDDIPELIAWLEELNEARQKPKPGTH